MPSFVLKSRPLGSCPAPPWVSATGAGRRVVGWLLAGLLLLGLPGRAQPLASAWARDPILSQVLVQQLATDEAGYCWVAADEGIFRYDGYALVPLRKLLTSGQVRPPSQHVRAIISDARGRLWIAADEGLFCLNPTSGTLRRLGWPRLPKAGQGLILFCHPRSQILWVFDEGGTLLILDPNHPNQPRPGPVPLSFAPLLVQAGAG